MSDKFAANVCHVTGGVKLFGGKRTKSTGEHRQGRPRGQASKERATSNEPTFITSFERLHGARLKFHRRGGLVFQRMVDAPGHRSRGKRNRANRLSPGCISSTLSLPKVEPHPLPRSERTRSETSRCLPFNPRRASRACRSGRAGTRASRHNPPANVNLSAFHVNGAYGIHNSILLNLGRKPGNSAFDTKELLEGKHASSKYASRLGKSKT